MALDDIRIGIVGAGANTRAKHIPGFRALEGVRIDVVRNRSRASSEAVAREFAIPRVADSWPELVADPEIDAVLIGTWPYLHGPATLAALAAGKHVLCEARMAMNLAEARAMQAAARSRPGVVAQVVPSPVTLGVDATVIRLLSDGYLGELVGAEVVVRSGDFPDPSAPLHWREDEDRSGLNVMGLGIFYEALMRWIGPAETVTALGGRAAPRRIDPETGRPRFPAIPDHLDVLARMRCGAHARFHFSTVHGLAPEKSITLFGAEGTLRFADGQLWGGQKGATAFSSIPIPPEEADSWRVEADFVAAIRGEAPVRLTTFADGVRYMAFTEAVHLSRTRGAAVPVETVESAGSAPAGGGRP